MRAGALDSLGGAGGDCLGRAARHSVPRRRGGGEAGGGDDGGAGQDGHADHRRVAGGNGARAFPPGREAEVAQLAYSLERLSTHPLARAITRHGKQQRLAPLELSNFESITGQGLRARRNGSSCLLGRREWLAQGPHASDHCRSASHRRRASRKSGWRKAICWDGSSCAMTSARKPRQVLEELRGEGLRTVVLTGDRKPTAEHLRTELHFDDLRAELKPEEKLAAIRALSSQGQRVAMVGDGVNDAPSLAAAHIGVAMGARGSDAALEQADVVLMHDRLENFLAAFRLSQRARSVIRQNLVISLGTVVVLVTFAMLGRISLTKGVVGHEGSTVVVVMNSLRLLVGGTSRRSATQQVKRDGDGYHP